MSGGSRNIGAQVKAARNKARMTTTRLAHRAGISESALEDVMSGSTDVSLGVLRRIAAATDMRLVVQLRRKDSAPTDSLCNSCFTTLPQETP